MANTLRNQKVRFALIVDAWRKAKKKTMDANTLNLFNEAKRILFDDDPNEQRKAELNKLHIKLREAANKNDDKSYDRISKKITKLATQKPVDRVFTDNEHRLVEIYLDQITPDAAQRLKTSQTKSKIAKNRRTVKGMSPQELDALKEKVRADYLEYKNKPREVAPSKNAFSIIHSKKLKNLKPSTIRSYLKDL